MSAGEAPPGGAPPGEAPPALRGFSHLVSLPNSRQNPDCNPWLTADEQELFYIIRDDRCAPPNPGYQGEWDIYVSQWDPINQTWGPPTNLGPNINTAGAERRSSTTASGDTLFFERDRRIYISFRTRGEFGSPVYLFDGMDPAITSDGQEFYFVHGGDLWVSNWTGSGWGVPVNLGPPINTDLWTCTPFLTQDGKRFYTGSESFEGSRGDEDLMVAYLDSTLAPEAGAGPTGPRTTV